MLEAGKLANYDEVVHTGLYSSLRVVGRIVLTPQAKQPFELNADSVEILGDCPADEYPLQKKKMSMELSLIHILLCNSLHDTVLLRFDVRHSFHLLGYL